MNLKFLLENDEPTNKPIKIKKTNNLKVVDSKPGINQMFSF